MDDVTSPKSPYHKGDLPERLLSAAETELETHGMEAFSLRKVAKRAGVSHAAPAHHFGDAAGVLTALATAGFRRLLVFQEEAEARAAQDARSQLIASGCGYVRFALAHPALFRLMFSSWRPNTGDAALSETASQAFQHLVERVTASAGKAPSPVELMAVWSVAHGLADLMINGKAKTLAALYDVHGERAIEAVLRAGIGGESLDIDPPDPCPEPPANP
ncbi:MAG: TetR/AcrR family transcriptional regulator [Pseudomonadota bacterium]